MPKVEMPQGKMLQVGPTGNVVLVTCCDKNGRSNIITVGMCMPISIDPPQVCIGIAPERYSHDLILEQGEFVVNSPSIALKDKMHLCGIKSGRDLDKFKEFGLTPIPAKMVRPPLIKECFGHIECEVVNRVKCGDHTLFVGGVLSASADEEVLVNGNLDALKAQPIVQKNYVYYTIKDARALP
jgi:flavin reductase (DIM6/NTAB) family NADH-FMN oxidoreductase RutF